MTHCRYVCVTSIRPNYVLAIAQVGLLLSSCGNGSTSTGQAATAGSVQELLLEERTKESGLQFVHSHGGIGNRELPETMGGGVALIDIENDGDWDVCFSQSGPMRQPGGGENRVGAANELFANDGSGRFSFIPDAAGAGDPGYGQGLAVGDSTGDGFDELLSLNWGPNRLYKNMAGRFVEQTEGVRYVDEWSVSAAFFDADGDGDLDLYVVNYVGSPPGSHLKQGRPDGFPAYPHPDNFQGKADRLYYNNGGGNFSPPVGKRIFGYRKFAGKGLGVAPTDINLDGHIDLYIANDSTVNFLFENNGKGKFTDVASNQGSALNDDGATEAGMGVDSADVDGDGDFDVLVTNLSNETNTCYINRQFRADLEGDIRQGTTGFSDRSARMGFAQDSYLMVGFGVLLNDLNRDGHSDFIVVNGHVMDNVAEISDQFSHAEPNQIFLGDGRGHFEQVDARIYAPGLERMTVSRGIASGDLDRDGDLDYIIGGNNEPAQVFFGALQGGSWLSLELMGPPGNHRGLGTSIWLEYVDGSKSLHRIESARAYASASQPILNTGLRAELRAIELMWPGGARERFEGLSNFAGHKVLRWGEGSGNDISSLAAAEQ